MKIIFHFQKAPFQYEESNDLEYEYKLVGYDLDWNQWAKIGWDFIRK